MTILVLLVGVVAVTAAAIMLAGASGPTRSINQVLYDTEHPGTGSDR